MVDLKVGDIVSRHSYGGDVYFVIEKIEYLRKDKPVYHLKGMLQRLMADSDGTDLKKHDSGEVLTSIQGHITEIKRFAADRNAGTRTAYRGFLPRPFFRSTPKPGTVLHIDSSQDFMERCLDHYREAGIKATGYCAPESEQPGVVTGLLKKNRPDVLVVTGHDAMKKGAVDKRDLNNYRNSRYYVQSVKEARSFESNPDRLCVYAGACQSCFEEIMSAGANFASSPARILINALDPALVSEKVDTTDVRMTVTPREVARVTLTGSDGIWGVNTRGRLRWI